MTLKDKFDKNVRYDENGIESEMCVLIADDFAVEFAEWHMCQVIITEMHLPSTKELLEMFKKEKGL